MTAKKKSKPPAGKLTRFYLQETEYQRLKLVEAKWNELCEAVGVNPHAPISSKTLAALRQAKKPVQQPEDHFIKELQRATGATTQYTWLGLLGVVRGIDRDNNAYRKDIEELRSLTAKQKVEADKWREACTMYGTNPVEAVSALSAQVDNYYADKLCKALDIPVIAPIGELWNKAVSSIGAAALRKARADVVLTNADLEWFWTKLVSGLGLSTYAVMCLAGRTAVMERVTNLRAEAQGWAAVCSATGMQLNTNYPSVIAKLQQGKDRWLDLCKHVGIAPDVSMEAVLKQTLEMYDLAPPKNMAEFFRIKMPMVLDGKTRRATFVVSTQIE